MKLVLDKYKNTKDDLLQNIINDFDSKLLEYKKLPYDIKFDAKRLESVLEVLDSIINLNKETYIRNFSAAVLKDYKKFQNSFRTTIENILFDYTDTVTKKDRILEVYNLFDNPTYVFIKGDVELRYTNSIINLSDIKGGIAIPNSALNDIISIRVNTDNVITVENLTSYHDMDSNNAVFIYLGGFHNLSKQNFLKILFSQNKDKKYFHKGDIDVYGFLILENLKAKTNIPFKPLEMDITTLKKFFENGLYKELSAIDKKIIIENDLSAYREVIDFMLKNNCKAEQESIKALEILSNK